MSAETHPENFCQRCGRQNITWFTPNDLWNRVMPEDGIVCPVCFVQSAEAIGITPSAWEVAPEKPVCDIGEAMIEIGGIVRECAKAYGEKVPYFSSHDAAKRLYRMGWRRVAEPVLSTCRRCGAENVITAQAVCIDCRSALTSAAEKPPFAIRRETTQGTHE